jgi:hypothetical protein
VSLVLTSKGGRAVRLRYAAHAQTWEAEGCPWCRWSPFCVLILQNLLARLCFERAVEEVVWLSRKPSYPELKRVRMIAGGTWLSSQTRTKLHELTGESSKV